MNAYTNGWIGYFGLSGVWLFPEFDRMSETLEAHLDEVANRVITDVLESDPPAKDEPEQRSLLQEPGASGSSA